MRAVASFISLLIFGSFVTVAVVLVSVLGVTSVVKLSALAKKENDIHCSHSIDAANEINELKSKAKKS